MENGVINLSRRSFLKYGIAVGLSGMAGSWALSKKWKGLAYAASKPQQVTMIWHIVNNQAERFKPALKKWEIDYPDVKVNFVQVPNIEQVTEKTIAMYAAGEVFDCAVSPLGMIPALAKDGVIRPLDGLAGVEKHISELIPSVVPLLKVGGKTFGVPAFICSTCGAFNMKLFEKAGIKSPPTTWEETREICLKAKKDGISKFPIIFPSGPGSDHGPSVWLGLIATVGGTVTDKDGNPTLGPGSKGRLMLDWMRKSYLDWKIADPRGLDLRYYPGAKAYATGDYLMHLATRQVFFTQINGGDSPTIGQHQIMVMPGDKTLITGELAAIGVTEYPEWSWRILQYLMGRTKDGELLGPKQMAKEALTPFPIRLLDDPEINSLYKKMFGSLDVYKETLTRSIAHNVIAPAIQMPWWSKWNDQMNILLQDCFRGKITSDQACDQLTEVGRRLKRS